MKQQSALRSLFLGLFCLIFGQSVLSANLSVAVPNQQWWSEVAQGNRELATKLGLNTTPESLKTLALVREKMLFQGPKGFTLGLIHSDEVNAYAKKEVGYTLIIFTSGFLLRFGNDQDVIATTLGHEMAHHLLGHTDTRSPEINSPIYMLANHSHTHTHSGSKNAHDHKPNIQTQTLAKQVLDNERQADLLGIQWAMNAGFSACGSYRLAQGLEAVQKDLNASLNLTSHPSNLERMEIAQNFHQLKNRSTSCSVDTNIGNNPKTITEPASLEMGEEFYIDEV